MFEDISGELEIKYVFPEEFLVRLEARTGNVHKNCTFLLEFINVVGENEI